jgi:peptidoglycan/LPS O-acetylase OafA/YrhL
MRDMSRAYEAFGAGVTLRAAYRGRTAANGILPYLDGLRAVAVSLVLLVHFPYVQGSAISKGLWDIGQAMRAGYIGVDLFFVLSGFLITRILLKEKKKNGVINLKLFFTKRALRIIPIYYICVIIFSVCLDNSFGILLSLLTFTVNFHNPIYPISNALEHTWSLSVEEQFYLVWPFLIARLPLHAGLNITRFVIPGISILVALMLAANLESELAARFIYMSSPTRMMSLSLGASLAYLEARKSITSDRQSFVLLTLGIALLIADNIGRHFGIVAAGGYYWCIALLGYALLSASAVSLLVFSRNEYTLSLRHVLELEPVRYIGRISYGLYVYHYLILYLLDVPQYKVAATGTSAVRFFAALAISLAVAAVSYRFLETPLLGLKRRLT